MTISLSNITKIYKTGEREVRALNDVTITIKRGEFVVITGPSGSGKSTLMNILGCLDQPTSGSYTIDGQEVGVLENNALATTPNRKIGVVFQNLYFLPRMTVWQNVSLPLMFAGIDKQGQYEVAAQALETVGLGNCMKHRLNTLSRGQRIQVAIARALINDPGIVLADELTDNLDTKLGNKIMCTLKKINRQGRTTIIVTHEPDVLKQAQRIIVVWDGYIVRNEQCAGAR